MVNDNSDADKSIHKNSIEYDPLKLADLASRAIGTRSVAEFCFETNLSKSFVSRILNGKLKNAPARRTLYRFAGENARPQNGVTLNDMLTASGYEASTVDFPISDESDPQRNLTLADSIQLYFSQSPALGLNLLLDALIIQGYGKAYSIDFELGMFSLKVKKPLESQYTTVIGIPAFCPDATAITTIQITVLTNLISSINIYPLSQSLFFIITDNEQLYQLLYNSLPVLQDMRLAILLANETYSGFSKQNTIVSDTLGKVCEDFPLMLCNPNIVKR